MYNKCLIANLLQFVQIGVGCAEAIYSLRTTIEFSNQALGLRCSQNIMPKSVYHSVYEPVGLMVREMFGLTSLERLKMKVGLHQF